MVLEKGGEYCQLTHLFVGGLTFLLSYYLLAHVVDVEGLYKDCLLSVVGLYFSFHQTIAENALMGDFGVEKLKKSEPICFVFLEISVVKVSVVK